MDNHLNYLVLRKVFFKGCSLSPILFYSFINDIFNEYDKYAISIRNKHCCRNLFADDIELCSQIKYQLRKLLKFTNKLARNNEIQFGINKYQSLIVRREVSEFLIKNDHTFYLSRQ